MSTILARRADQSRTYGVELDITRSSLQIRLVEDKRGEPSLPEVLPRRASRKLTILVYRQCAPSIAHVAAHRPNVVPRSVHVIGHQAVDPDLDVLARQNRAINSR